MTSGGFAQSGTGALPAQEDEGDECWSVVDDFRCSLSFFAVLKIRMDPERKPGQGQKKRQAEHEDFQGAAHIPRP